MVRRLVKRNSTRVVGEEDGTRDYEHPGRAPNGPQSEYKRVCKTYIDCCKSLGELQFGPQITTGPSVLPRASINITAEVTNLGVEMELAAAATPQLCL